MQIDTSQSANPETRYRTAAKSKVFWIIMALIGLMFTYDMVSRNLMGQEGSKASEMTVTTPFGGIGIPPFLSFGCYGLFALVGLLGPVMVFFFVVRSPTVVIDDGGIREEVLGKASSAKSIKWDDVGSAKVIVSDDNTPKTKSILLFDKGDPKTLLLKLDLTWLERKGELEVNMKHQLEKRHVTLY
jgi:hypothetical protein